MGQSRPLLLWEGAGRGVGVGDRIEGRGVFHLLLFLYNIDITAGGHLGWDKVDPFYFGREPGGGSVSEIGSKVGGSLLYFYFFITLTLLPAAILDGTKSTPYTLGGAREGGRGRRSDRGSGGLYSTFISL